jgi:hypothetical protein
MDVIRTCGQTGRKHIYDIKRVAITLAHHQLSLIEFYDAQVENFSYYEVGSYAK